MAASQHNFGFISSSKRGKLTRKRHHAVTCHLFVPLCRANLCCAPSSSNAIRSRSLAPAFKSRFQRFVAFFGIIYLLLTPAPNINHRTHLTSFFHHVRLFPHMKQSPLFICILGLNLTTPTSRAMAPHQVPLVGQVRVATPKPQLSSNKLMTPLVS